MPTIHEASFNGSSIALPSSMMRRSYDGQVQSTMKSWVPRTTSPSEFKPSYEFLK